MSAIILLRFLIHLRILSWTSAKIWLFCKLKHQLVGLGLQMCQMWDGISCAVSLCMKHNVLWYGVVRDYEAISYQFIPTFFTSHKRSQTVETRMHYTMCCMLAVFCPPCVDKQALWQVLDCVLACAT